MLDAEPRTKPSGPETGTPTCQIKVSDGSNRSEPSDLQRILGDQSADIELSQRASLALLALHEKFEEGISLIEAFPTGPLGVDTFRFRAGEKEYILNLNKLFPVINQDTVDTMTKLVHVAKLAGSVVDGSGDTIGLYREYISGQDLVQTISNFAKSLNGNASLQVLEEYLEDKIGPHYRKIVAENLDAGYWDTDTKGQNYILVQNQNSSAATEIIWADSKKAVSRALVPTFEGSVVRIREESGMLRAEIVSQNLQDNELIEELWQSLKRQLLVESLLANPEDVEAIFANRLQDKLAAKQAQCDAINQAT